MDGTSVRLDVDSGFRRTLRVLQRDKPLSLNTSLANYLHLRSKEMEFKRKNMLSPELFDMLCLGCSLYLRTKQAFNAYMICKVLGLPSINSSVMNVRLKLEHLKDRGLMELIGKGNKGSNIYLPTERAYKELSELIK